MCTNVEDLVLYGAGGFAREVAWLIENCPVLSERVRVVCFVDDDESKHGEILNDIPVLGIDESLLCWPEAKVTCAIGSPKRREAVASKAMAVGLAFRTVIHSSVSNSEWVDIGVGTVICAGSVLTTNIVLGEHVQINLGCTVGHDVVMERFSTLAPGVHVSGNVHIEQRAYVGTGAVIINGTSEKPVVIGENAVVGAGAVVTRDVEPGTTVVGVPARPIRP